MSEIKGRILEFRVPEKKRAVSPEENKTLDYYKDYAQKAYDAGDYKTAIASLQAALELTDEGFELELMIADCYFELSDFDQAGEIYEKLLLEQPKNSEIIYRLGRVYLQNNWEEKAVEKFEEALKLSPENQEIGFYLGDTLAYLGMKSEAISHLQKITEEPFKGKAQRVLKIILENPGLKIHKKTNEELP